MSELSTVAQKLVEEAKALNAEIDAIDDPPSRAQIATLQDARASASPQPHPGRDRHVG